MTGKARVTEVIGRSDTESLNKNRVHPNEALYFLL